MKAKLEAAWAWLKKWGAWIAGALLVIVGAGWAWQRRGQLLGAARDAAVVAEAKRQMDATRATREEVARQVGEKDEAVQALDDRIARQRRLIVRLHEGGEALVGEDLEHAARELGL